MPKLRELEPKFLKIVSPSEYRFVDTLQEAQGISFLCPKCYAANKGPAGTHSVLCWFAGKGVPDELSPKPGRWVPQGTNFDDLTFVGPGAASILLTGGCGWHGFIHEGEAA